MIYLTSEQVKLYFYRLGVEIPTDPKPDRDLLFALHYGHTTHVPFENLDILNHVPLSLEEDDLFDKIVTRRRGGICFEVNCLFAHLLRTLGYTCIDYSARWIKGAVGNPLRRHRAFCCQLPSGERYICDVGNGQRAPRYPVPFILDTDHKQEGEVYTLLKDEKLGIVLNEYHKGKYTAIYSFTEEFQYDTDFIIPMYFCEHHALSPVVYDNVISIKTATGRKTLGGNTFRVFDGDTVTETVLGDKAAVDRCLADEFGLVFTKK